MPRKKKISLQEKIEQEKINLNQIENGYLLDLTIGYIQSCTIDSSPSAEEYAMRDLYMAELNRRLIDSKWMSTPFELDY